MRKRQTAILIFVVAVFFCSAAPSSAIIGGRADSAAHPYVGAVVGLGPVTPSGVLISSTVFLTAGHVTRFFDNAGATRASVTFDPVATPLATTYEGSVHTNPAYDPNRLDDRVDLGVIVFDSPVPVVPALLPTLNLLDRSAAGTPFTAAGYGITAFVDHRPDVQSGGSRKAIDEQLMSVTPGWLRLQPEGGELCIGDSGAPSLANGSDLVGGITVGALSISGGQCEGAVWDQRIDTPAAREFLGKYVSLP